ncbi:MAG: AraC family transcriptional regulator [Clostridiales bacterium]|nr:AraC family transcriptional regulator [Clostridiales bacterium]
MDLLKKMNKVIDYIEDNITNSNIDYQEMANVLYCSVYEFSRIFPFIAGMSVSEYIRKRKLSLAVFDIQNSTESLVDIALKYCYESQSSFTRAFKAMHNVTPAMAKKQGVSLKTYPKLSFEISIKGAREMEFRIEKKASFKIIGLKGYSDGKSLEDTELDAIWDEFLDRPGDYDKRLYNGGGENNYYHAPFWQVAAYSYEKSEKGARCIIGAELASKPILDGMETEPVPASTWAVFTIRSRTGALVPEAYTRVITEWLPTSSYKRDKSKPNMESFPPGAMNDDYEWEIWLPVVEK